VAELKPLQALIRMGKDAVVSPIIPYYLRTGNGEQGTGNSGF
jgi:hypothetical protein